MPLNRKKSILTKRNSLQRLKNWISDQILSPRSQRFANFSKKKFRKEKKMIFKVLQNAPKLQKIEFGRKTG